MEKLKEKELTETEKLQLFVAEEKRTNSCVFCLEELTDSEYVKIEDLGFSHYSCLQIYENEFENINNLLVEGFVEEAILYFRTCREMSRQGADILGDAYYS